MAAICSHRTVRRRWPKSQQADRSIFWRCRPSRSPDSTPGWAIHAMRFRPGSRRGALRRVRRVGADLRRRRWSPPVSAGGGPRLGRTVGVPRTNGLSAWLSGRSAPGTTMAGGRPWASTGPHPVRRPSCHDRPDAARSTDPLFSPDPTRYRPSRASGPAHLRSSPPSAPGLSPEPPGAACATDRRRPTRCRRCAVAGETPNDSGGRCPAAPARQRVHHSREHGPLAHRAAPHPMDGAWTSAPTEPPVPAVRPEPADATDQPPRRGVTPHPEVPCETPA